MPTPLPPASTDLLRIGCAGWSIGREHRALFGDGDSALARYATRFNTVEINSSFYRPHQQKTYVRWADTVPKDFLFSVKIPKAVTHTARLVQTGPLLDAFLEQAQGLGGKLGCLLVQLPPSLVFDARVAANFFGVLRRRWNGKVACEPRHASWFSAGPDPLWQRYRVTRVGADPPPSSGARHSIGAPEVRYWRLHGSPKIYYSAYDDAALRAAIARVIGDTPVGAADWVIFDNTALGHATTDALRFEGLIKGRG
jgi:uncharacterized protein YecE (DUF72 family)